MITIDARILQRTDTKENWLLSNPVLGKNERAFEVQPDGTRKEKLGDGVTTYKLLPYYAVEIIADNPDDSEESVLKRGIPSDVTVGAINPSDVLELGMTFTEFVERLVTKTFFPTFTAPSFNLGHAESGLIEIGTILTVDLVFTFNRGTINQSWAGTTLPYAGTAYGYRFYFTDDSGFETVGNPNYAIPNYFVKSGNNTFKADVVYNAGEQPKDSKGNDYAAPLAGGISPLRQTQFEGVYGIYASTSNITTATRLALISMLSGNNVQINMVAESGGNKQFFDVPDEWLSKRPLQSVQYYDALTGTFDTSTNHKNEFPATQNGKVIQGQATGFKRHTYNGPNRGAILIRLVF